MNDRSPENRPAEPYPHLAQGEGTQAYLLFDPRLHPPAPESVLGRSLCTRPFHQLHEVPGGPPRAQMPMLLPLDPSQAGDSFLLQESMRAAQEELDPVRLRQGQGRSLGIWLECALDMPQLAAHIEHRMAIRRPNGLPTVFYWIDPAVLWGLWPILRPPQQAALLGPIQRLHLLTPGGDLETLGNPEPQTQSPVLDVDAEQLQRIQQIGVLNAMLRELPQPPTTAQAWTHLRDRIQAALAQARSLGLLTPRDQRAFAECALELGPAFERHPRMAAYFTQTEESSFTAFIADLGDEVRQRIRQELAFSNASGQQP